MKDNKKKQKNFAKKEIESEGFVVHTEVDRYDEYAGDSVDEHKQMEEANEFIDEEIIGQIKHNS